MTALLTDNLPLLAGAPNGIKKLRELILELAVRGKLLPQDPSDEPASELLKRIAEEKALSGNLKKTKLLAEITEDEQPFAAPSSWVLSRLGYVGEWAVGSGFPTQEQGLTNQPIPFCKVSDMNLSGNERSILTANNSIDETTASRLRVNVHPAGTVVFPKIGGAIATNKRRLLVKPTAIDNNCLGLTPNGILSSDYLYLLLSSIDLTRYQAGTSVPALSQGVLADIIVGVPPLAEQDRIIAKVDELMTLCDRLEAQQADAKSAHTQLVQALLDSLTQASDAPDFATNWQRLTKHFHTLFTTEPSIDALKQTLLQLAVMGKLVPQDPSEEPASELLKRITEEKRRLVAVGKVKKGNFKAEVVAESVSAFELPVTWTWTTFDDLINPEYPVAYGVLVPGPNVVDGVPFVRIADLDLVAPPQMPEKSISSEVDRQFERTRIRGGEILMGVVGSIGKLGIAPPSWAGANIARAVCRLVPCDQVSKEYVILMLQSELMKKQFLGDTRTLAQPTLNIGLIRSASTPLPPLAEQHRIVAKVDQLMALCDQLKIRLTQARQLNEQLASTLVEQAVA